VLCAMSKVH